MPDYSNGKIYKITSPNCEEVYVGSTTQSLDRRLTSHKSDCKIKNCTSKKVIDYGDAAIELIEEFICETRTELERREGEIQKSTLNCCNKIIAGRTNKEWREANNYTIIQQRVEYQKINKDKIKKRMAEYYQKKKSALVI